MTPPAVVAAEREVQKSYWLEHSKNPTVEAMMLDSKASEIDLLERPEVLSTLGSVHSQHVLELGAGIGRFTGELAKTAAHVLACDFMDTSIAENRRVNGALRNCDFCVSDVTELDLPAGSFDVVFSNWLLMYLGDAEVLQLARNALSWLCEGGIFFFRESCFRQSGDRARKANPTHYRNPREYFRILDDVEFVNPDGSISHFELVNCKCVDTYVQVKRNQNQICWKWRKVTISSPRMPLYRKFLDQQQYSSKSILRYERVFGAGFVSTGGADTTKDLLQLLQLQPGEKVLDVGCGIGGGDFLMSEMYGVHVHALDLSVNMILMALERAGDIGGAAAKDVTFEVADAMSRDFAPGSFDVIYSRDALLHVHDKATLFNRFLDWLRPGGRLLITDYCRAATPPKHSFAAYIKQRGYDLLPVEQYGQLLTAAGFMDVQATDKTQQSITCLEEELSRLSADKAAFLADFSEDDYNCIRDGWTDKLVRAKDGEQKWGLFTAHKP
eukprot:jgi/Chrzof1/6654/Cz19g04140.t1